MKKAMILVFLVALSVPIFAVVVTSDDLTSMYGVTYEERQSSDYLEKDGYSFEYLGEGKWEVTRLSGSSGSSSSRAASSGTLPRNWISGEVNFFGGGARYDFQINNKLSVGALVYYNWFFFIWDTWGIQATGRFYPGVMGNTFYAGFNFGFGAISSLGAFTDDDWWYRTTGVLLTPALGWKIKIGRRPTGFFINPDISVPIVFGTKKYYDYWGDQDSKFNVDWSFKLAVNFGFAF